MDAAAAPAAAPAAAHDSAAYRVVDPIAYYLPVYQYGIGENGVAIYPDFEELLAWIADEGQYRADPEVLEVIERTPDGTVIRHERETVDAWCAARDNDITLDRDHQRSLGPRRASV